MRIEWSHPHSTKLSDEKFFVFCPPSEFHDDLYVAWWPKGEKSSNICQSPCSPSCDPAMTQNIWPELLYHNCHTIPNNRRTSDGNIIWQYSYIRHTLIPILLIYILSPPWQWVTQGSPSKPISANSARLSGILLAHRHCHLLSLMIHFVINICRIT